jgi:predicted nucleotidyltransferase
VVALPGEIERLLDPFLGDLHGALGDELEAVWVFGSAVAGGFDPIASDFDVIVVTRGDVVELGIEVFQGLVEAVAARSAEWADRIDIVFVGHAVLASFRSGGSLYAISHDEPLQRFDDADDWLQTWFVVRRSSAVVVGPPAADVIPPISIREFQLAVAQNVAGLVERVEREGEAVRDGVLAYTVLTLCRVLITLERGEVVAKDDAAAWVAARGPELADALATVRAVRLLGENARFAPDERAAARAAMRRLAADVAAARDRLERPAARS